MHKLSRVLLANDDGIDAPGLKLLEEIAASYAEEVWVIAPSSDQSGAAQRMTLQTPVRCIRRDATHIAIDGTPADCVCLGLRHFLKDTPPDLVMTGINSGSNVGEEVNFSGTLGSAATAQMLGFTAFAFSQIRSGDRTNVPWETSRKWAPQVLDKLLEMDFPKGSCVSINFPKTDHVNGMHWTRQGRGNVNGVRVEPCPNFRGMETYWLLFEDDDTIRGNGETDLDAVARGEIALTLIGPDRSLPPQG